jgi:hypothetical protein
MCRGEGAVAPEGECGLRSLGQFGISGAPPPKGGPPLAVFWAASTIWC